VLNSLASGGTERSTVELLPALADDGIDATVAVLQRASTGFADEVADTGADLAVLPGTSLAHHTIALRRLIRARRPALVHTALFESDLVGRVAAAGGPPVLTSLVNDSYGPGRRADQQVARWKLETTRVLDALSGRLLTTHFHAVSPSVKNAAVRDLGISARRITVVPRSRDPRRLGTQTPEHRAAAKACLGIDADQRVVLALGRVEYQKGHRHLVEALSLTVGAGAGAMLLVAGRAGAHTAQIQALAERKTMTDRIRLLGHRGDVGDLLAAADVFAMPSLYEGCAGALLEACIAGVPVVASDLPPIRDLVAKRPATRLVPPARPAPLAAALDELLEDPEAARRLCQASRAAYAAAATPESVNRRMAELYRACGRRPAADRRPR
jgi:glycosyltransferase involved in cell wall biosynthesis